LKSHSPDNRLRDDATEDLNGQLDRLVNQLASRGVTLSQAREIFERQFILASLQLNHGNITNSANHLGLHRNTLRNKVATLQIQATDYRGSSKRIQSR